MVVYDAASTGPRFWDDAASTGSMCGGLVDDAAQRKINSRPDEHALDKHALDEHALGFRG